MNSRKTLTWVRMAIPNAADVQACLSETPASLTLCTPKVAVQVQIENVQVADRKPLPKPPMAG